LSGVISNLASYILVSRSDLTLYIWCQEVVTNLYTPQFVVRSDLVGLTTPNTVQYYILCFRVRNRFNKSKTAVPGDKKMVNAV
jgi:hypothetical protein